MAKKSQTCDFKSRMVELYDIARDLNYKVGREKFAEQSGITLGQLNGYLAGQSVKFCETLKIIAQRNGTNVSWLTGESDEFVVKEDNILHGLTAQEINKVKEFIGYLQYMRSKEER